MFVLPALVLPLVLGLAIYRLYQVPRGLVSGELRLPLERRLLWSAAGVAAYALLLGYTLVLSASLVRLLFVSGSRLQAYLSLLGYVAAYPVIYVAAAWVFYYALVPVGANGGRPAP